MHGSYTSTAGFIRPVARKCDTGITRSRNGRSSGVFDGFTFTDSLLERTPWASVGLNAAEVLDNANGMFLSVGVHDGNARIISDPWGTLPFYYGVRAGGFFGATSLRLVRDVLNEDGYDETGVAQFLTFGRVIAGGTIFRSIHKLSCARMLDIDFSRDGTPDVRESEYFNVTVEPDEYAGIERDVTDAFRQALISIGRRTEGRVLCTLSGGMDSRTIAAAAKALALPFVFATHYSTVGNDVVIAREVACALGIDLKEIRYDSELPSDRAHEYAQATNGMASFHSYNAMYLYPEYLRLCDVMVDGNHTWIEGRWFLRNTARKIRDKDDFFRYTRDILLRNSLLTFAREPAKLRTTASDILWNLIPDLPAHRSVACLADTFNAKYLLPNHNTNLALLQKQYTGYVSPYFDLRYTMLVSRIGVRKRWKQEPQYHIVRTFAPRIANLHRSYTEVKTLSVSNPFLMRLPVAYDRLVRTAGRRPGLRIVQHCSIARPSNAFRIRADLGSIPPPRRHPFVSQRGKSARSAEQ